MRFWNTSALIPLMIAEARTPDVRLLLADDDRIVTAEVTTIEVTSAIWRRRHDGEWSSATLGGAERNFAEVSSRWTSLGQSPRVVETALDLLSCHRIGTLDAIQLATALVVAEHDRSLPIVTLDQRLATSARAEGFPVLP